jgi:hypothetical protein
MRISAPDDPVEQVAPWNQERQRQQEIPHQTEQKSAEKEEGRPRDDGRRRSAVHRLSICVHTHGCTLRV